MNLKQLNSAHIMCLCLTVIATIGLTLSLISAPAEATEIQNKTLNKKPLIIVKKVDFYHEEIMENYKAVKREEPKKEVKKETTAKKEKKVEKTKEVKTEKKVQKKEKTKEVKKSGNPYGYTDAELDLICAIVAQESCVSYNGSLAVISTVLNRMNHSDWAYLGNDPLEQFCYPGQFTYSIDGLYKKRLNGNYPDYVKQAVMDGLNGKRNHDYVSFRGYEKPGSVKIGDNYYFNETW